MVEVLHFILWVSFIFVYIIWAIFAVWVTNFKKKWQRYAAFIISILITPLIFVAICVPLQYMYQKRKGLLTE